MEEPLLPILSQSPCTSHNFMLWTRRGDEIYWRRLQRLWAIMETPHASNTDIFARVMRLVWTWETQDFYLPQSVAHRDIFEAADSVPSSTVSSASPHSGAHAAAGEKRQDREQLRHVLLWTFSKGYGNGKLALLQRVILP